MKFLADENIPASVVVMLENSGFSICSVRMVSAGISDREVMQIASREERIILTFDKDFGELAVKDAIIPVPGVILFRLPGMKPDQLASFITGVLTSREDRGGHFSVVETERIRMRQLSFRN